MVTASSSGKDPAYGAVQGVNFAFPAWSAFRPAPPGRHVARPRLRGERRAAVGGATAEDTNGEARRGAEGKSQRTCAEETKCREAGSNEPPVLQTETENAVLRRLRSYEYGRRREEKPTTHACPELDPLSLRADAPGTCPKCPDRPGGGFPPAPRAGPHRAAFLAEACLPHISGLQLPFSLPDLQALTLPPIRADNPLNSYIRKESWHHHADASGSAPGSPI